MRHCTLIFRALLVVVLTAVGVGGARAATPCASLPEARPDGFSWLVPGAAGIARATIEVPASGWLALDVVAHGAVTPAWVRAAHCDGRPLDLLDAAFGRPIYAVDGPSRLLIEAGVAVAGPAASSRLTLDARFVPTRDGEGDGTEGSDNEILPVTTPWPAREVPTRDGEGDGEGGGTEGSDNEILPVTSPWPAREVPTRDGEGEAGGDGTEGSDNEILPVTAPVVEGAWLLAAAAGPVHTDHGFVSTRSRSWTVEAMADAPVRLDVVTEDGVVLIAVPAEAHEAVSLRLVLPDGRYAVRVLASGEHSVAYRLRLR